MNRPTEAAVTAAVLAFGADGFKVDGRQAWREAVRLAVSAAYEVDQLRAGERVVVVPLDSDVVDLCALGQSAAVVHAGREIAAALDSTKEIPLPSQSADLALHFFDLIHTKLSERAELARETESSHATD